MGEKVRIYILQNPETWRRSVQFEGSEEPGETELNQRDQNVLLKTLIAEYQTNKNK